MDSDDKNAKFEQSQLDSSKATTQRRVVFYILLASLLMDVYASKAGVLDHLTIWSWTLHTLYFELHLCCTTPTMTKILHGPSFTGAHALFFMYVWTMIANPNMEFDLAPPGRAAWLVYTRAFFMHFAPILFHWVDLLQNQTLLAKIYDTHQNTTSSSSVLSSLLVKNSYFFQFWACVGGYFAMGLTWEHFNGDAAATYNVTIVDDETYVAISKAIGVLSCVASFLLGLRPRLISAGSSATTSAMK